MRVKEVGITYGETKNLGNFESLRIDVQLKVDVEPGEPSQELLNDLYLMARKKADEFIDARVKLKKINTKKAIEKYEDCYE